MPCCSKPGLPTWHLVREIGKSRKAVGYQELIKLKRMYRVSASALLVRLRQIGVIDESTLAYAFQTFPRGLRANEPEPLEGPGEEGRHELPGASNGFAIGRWQRGSFHLPKQASCFSSHWRQSSGLKEPAGADADHRK
jgi:hypothetical protein